MSGKNFCYMLTSACLRGNVLRVRRGEHPEIDFVRWLKFLAHPIFELLGYLDTHSLGNFLFLQAIPDFTKGKLALLYGGKLGADHLLDFVKAVEVKRGSSHKHSNPLLLTHVFRQALEKL